MLQDVMPHRHPKALTRSTMYGAVTMPILPTTPLSADRVHLSVVGYTSVCHTSTTCQDAEMKNFPITLNTVTAIDASVSEQIRINLLVAYR